MNNFALNNEIEFLVDCQEHIQVLAKLYYEEISRHWIADSSIEKATDRLIDHLNRDKLPLAIVALCEGNPVGMACLRETDGIQPGVTPWLGSLVVDPKFRKRKIGDTLIEAIKYQAKLHGYAVLHLFAFDPLIPNWYKKLGWHFIGKDHLLGHCVTVMNISI